jgi:hypothetical protein
MDTRLSVDGRRAFIKSEPWSSLTLLDRSIKDAMMVPVFKNTLL